MTGSRVRRRRSRKRLAKRVAIAGVAESDLGVVEHGLTPADLMVQANRRLFEEVRDLGGYRYPVGAVPVSHNDWMQHFGPVWSTLAEARQRYDPANVLTPGQGIFP